MTSLQSLAFYTIRALGGFSLAQYLTRKQLRILCYHGFSVGDEYQVMPWMFMRAETFERRMRILEKRGVAVVSLDEAVRRLARGEIENAQTVITLDDGWESNLSIGMPILEKHGFPACIYIATEHLGAASESFNVALNYMLYRTQRESLVLEGVHPQIDGVYEIRKEPVAALLKLIAAAELALPLEGRVKLLRPIGQALGVDPDTVLENGRFRLLEGSQIQGLFRRGIEIELHTHSHRLPDQTFETMAQEIERNREALEALIGTVPRHFCYPSGMYNSDSHPEWLTRLGIASATTCDPGFNYSSTPLMLLKRYLDSDQTSDIAFEAEVCGVRELARRARAAAARWLRG